MEPSARQRRFMLEVCLLGAILFLAAWLRFSHLDQVEFTWDQAEFSKWALRMVRQGEIAWAGPPTSTGIQSFTATLWLIAIPYAFSLSPVFATGFITLLNTIAVIGCYGLTRRWFGSFAALVAALLYAVAPWAVIYSRKIWHPVLLPSFMLLCAATGWLAFVQGRRWALIAHGLALAVAVQIHFSAFVFVPVSLLLALIFYRRLDWRVVLASGLLAALTFVPYLVYDAQHNWENVRQLGKTVGQPVSIDTQAAQAAQRVTAGLGLAEITGPNRYADFVAETPNVRWLFAVEGVLALVGGALAVWQAARRVRIGLDEKTAAAIMVAAWLAMPILFSTRHSTPVYTHYFISTFPAQFILIGWLVAQVGRALGQIVRFNLMSRVSLGALVGLVALLAAAQAYESASLLRFIATHNTNQGFPTPLSFKVAGAQTATRLLKDSGSTEVILLSEGDDPRRFEMPAVADVLLYRTPHRSVDIQTALVIPSGPAIYWTTYDTTPNETLLATLTPEITQMRIPLREGIGSFRFYRWPGGEPVIPTAQPLPGGPRTWTNGARLIGYRLEGDLHPGGTIHWTLIWQTTQTSIEENYYHWFNHLLDQQGQMRGQKDGPSFLPTFWRPGDTVLNLFDLQISPDAPAGDYRMRVGMYAYPAIKNVSVSDATGGPTSESVEIGPFHVEK